MSAEKTPCPAPPAPRIFSRGKPSFPEFLWLPLGACLCEQADARWPSPSIITKPAAGESTGVKTWNLFVWRMQQAPASARVLLRAVLTGGISPAQARGVSKAEKNRLK